MPITQAEVFLRRFRATHRHRIGIPTSMVMSSDIHYIEGTGFVACPRMYAPPCHICALGENRSVRRVILPIVDYNNSPQSALWEMKWWSFGPTTFQKLRQARSDVPCDIYIVRTGDPRFQQVEIEGILEPAMTRSDFHGRWEEQAREFMGHLPPWRDYVPQSEREYKDPISEIPLPRLVIGLEPPITRLQLLFLGDPDDCDAQEHEHHDSGG